MNSVKFDPVPVCLAWTKLAWFAQTCRRMQSRRIVFRFFRCWLLMRSARVCPPWKRTFHISRDMSRARFNRASEIWIRPRSGYIKQEYSSARSSLAKKNLTRQPSSRWTNGSTVDLAINLPGTVPTIYIAALSYILSTAFASPSLEANAFPFSI